MLRTDQELYALRELARRRCRDSFKPYIQAVMPSYVFSRTGYHDRLVQTLELAGTGEITRLLINIPPRHSKSLTASILFPSWYMGRNPGHEVILCSYSAELAAGFSRRVRETVTSRPHKEIFPEFDLSDRATSVQLWETTKGGRFLAQGTGGSVTGFGANLLIIEDPVANREDAESASMSTKLWEWWTSVAFTRLAPDARIVLVGTRWSTRDLFGRILDQDHE